MLAILYLFIALFLGDRLRRLLLPPTEKLFDSISPRSPIHLPGWLFDLPAAMVLGLPPMLWATYWMAVLAAGIPGVATLSNPLLPANLVVMPSAFILALVLSGRLRDRSYTHRLTHRESAAAATQQPRSFTRFMSRSGVYIFVLIVMSLFGIWLMRTGIRIVNGDLHAGYSVFSDFGPHTAIISSFARGGNFPVQYPHFPMDGIRYHFLFYFLGGNLDFLGLPIDWAVNLPSILGLVSVCSLLGALGVLLTSRKIVFLAAPAFLYLRSSFAFLTYIRDAMRAGSTLIESIRSMLRSTVFIGNTLHEDWGLYSVNVYANQRHFLFGLSILFFLLFLFIPLLKNGLRPLAPDQSAWTRVLSVKAWAVPSFRVLIAIVLTVVCLPYLHGSILVAILLIIAGMLPFSAGRLQHVLTLGVAFVAARLQANLFSGGVGNVAVIQMHFGFLADKATVAGVILYCIELLGLAALLLPVLPWTQSGKYRGILAGAFLIPILFAFTFTLTPDVTVNHKYILITMAAANIFIVDWVARLWRRPRLLPQSRRVNPTQDGTVVSAGSRSSRIKEMLRKSLDRFAVGRFLLQHKPLLRTSLMVLRRSLVVVIVLFLISTGIADIAAYNNINKNTAVMDLDSPTVEWIMENTPPDAIFLTDAFAYDSFFYSGRMTYYGHPYYAWSAGHDTGLRESLYRRLLSGCDGDYNEFRTLCEQENVSYLLITNNLREDSAQDFNESFFTKNFPVSARFPLEENTVIHDLR